MGFTVKQARQYAGFTQREMAEKLGVSRDTYRKIEQSPEDATVATAKRISEVVGIPIDQIFFADVSTWDVQLVQLISVFLSGIAMGISLTLLLQSLR